MENTINQFLANSDDKGYHYDYGYGRDYGYGAGNGNGDSGGNGRGYGDGYGNGYRYGVISRIKNINGATVFYIDGLPTIIEKSRGNVAKGYIIKGDLTLSPCYIVKNDNVFAHGKTLNGAKQELKAKIFENLDKDETIEKFVSCHKKGVKYPAMDFFEWHHYLTGSCEFGRKSFAENHGIDLVNDKFTVDEFIELTKNDYGSDIINKLKDGWNQDV